MLQRGRLEWTPIRMDTIIINLHEAMKLDDEVTSNKASNILLFSSFGRHSNMLTRNYGTGLMVPFNSGLNVMIVTYHRVWTNQRQTLIVNTLNSHKVPWMFSMCLVHPRTPTETTKMMWYRTNCKLTYVGWITLSFKWWIRHGRSTGHQTTTPTPNKLII